MTSMTLPASAMPINCGNCLFHDKRECNNRNGRCISQYSKWHDIVTGEQGQCADWQAIPPPADEPMPTEQTILSGG